mgnify:CR=1 FL=1
MALGTMSYSEAKTCASELGKAASNMDQLFNNLRNEMDSLQEDLKSSAADELYATYKVLEAKLSSFPNKVRDFKGFLEAAVAQYEADDAALANEVR